MNRYFEEIDGTLVSTNKAKKTKNLDDYDKKYMKIKFNSDDKLPLNKTIEIPSLIKNKWYLFLKITKIICSFC